MANNTVAHGYNLLAANTWSANRHTTPTSLERSSGEERGVWWEWAVAAELFRRAAKEGHPTPLQSLFWRSEKHEIDFVRNGRPLDWSEGRPRLAVRGVTLEDFLLDESL